MRLGSTGVFEVGLVWLSFSPQSGYEQARRRPAICLSAKEYNAKTSLGIFFPITSKVKGYPFEVKLPKGLPIEGVILADQIRSLDWKARKAEFIAKVPNEVLEEVLNLIRLLLDF